MHPKYRDEAVVTLTSTGSVAARDLSQRTLHLGKQQSFVDIGRASRRNAALEPSSTNAYFDSAVMSRQHAKLSVDFQKQLIVLTDQASLHGTFRNNEPLTAFKPYHLNNDDVLQFGQPVDKGPETYPPGVVKFNVNFGTERPENSVNRPVVYRVPDDSDASSSSDEDDIASDDGHAVINQSLRILSDHGIHPRPFSLTSTSKSPIDLTLADEVAPLVVDDVDREGIDAKLSQIDKHCQQMSAEQEAKPEAEQESGHEEVQLEDTVEDLEKDKSSAENPSLEPVEDVSQAGPVSLEETEIDGTTIRLADFERSDDDYDSDYAFSISSIEEEVATSDELGIGEDGSSQSDSEPIPEELNRVSHVAQSADNGNALSQCLAFSDTQSHSDQAACASGGDEEAQAQPDTVTQSPLLATDHAIGEKAETTLASANEIASTPEWQHPLSRPFVIPPWRRRWVYKTTPPDSEWLPSPIVDGQASVFAPLPGRICHNSPPSEHPMRPSTTLSEHYGASAYEHEKAKQATKAQPSETQIDDTTHSHSRVPDTALQPTKRKASAISGLVPEEESQGADSSARNLSQASVTENLPRHESQETQHTTSDLAEAHASRDIAASGRPAKRLRRVGEMLGIAVLGGAAVMSALIATAPTL